MTARSRLKTSGRLKESAESQKSLIFPIGQQTKDFGLRTLGRKRPQSSSLLKSSSLTFSGLLREKVWEEVALFSSPFPMPNSPRSYAILGTGALGGFYGARLQKAGLDVHFLLHRDYEHVRKYGLAIESPDGDFSLPHVNAYCNAGDMPPCDVVVVALKTTQNSLLPQMLPGLLKDDGVVLVLQNGLGMEEEVARIVGGDRVIGGLCFTCNNKVGPGHIRHLDYGVITLAEYTPNYIAAGITQRMRQLESDFEPTGILIQLAPDLLLARWQKLICNIPFNGLSVILNATTEELLADIYGRELVEMLMQEIADVAAAYGRAIADEYIQKRLNQIGRIRHYLTSMKIDCDERRPIEVEAIFGNPLRAAINAGIHTPQLAMLYRQLKFFDARNRTFAPVLALS